MSGFGLFFVRLLFVDLIVLVVLHICGFDLRDFGLFTGFDVIGCVCYLVLPMFSCLCVLFVLFVGFACWLPC